MKANPGGHIDPQEVIGRDEIIDRIWDTLERQSIRMNAERRIGKTTIINKLKFEPRSGWAPIFQDLEQYHTAPEFVMAVFRAVERFLSLRQRTAGHAKALLATLGGTEVRGVVKLPARIDLPWKEILSSTVHDLVEERGKQAERTLFLWDEVPFMLANINDREGEPVAMEVLDALRGLRQTYGGRGLRMVLTGSIGLHHVITALKRRNYANAPLNDTFPVEVPPLDIAAARELAIRLIEGENIHTESRRQTAGAIAEAADRFPFYIHHIVKALKQSGMDGTPDSVEQVVSAHLVDASDPWELNHYRERIPVYYGQGSEQAVLGILDATAVRSEATTVDDLLAELKGTGTLDDRERLIDLLRLIEQDHYLARDAGGRLRFKFPLLQRWWKLARSL